MTRDGSTSTFLSPVGLTPVLEPVPRVRDVCEVDIGATGWASGERLLLTPGRTPSAVFSMFEFWDRISGSKRYETVETGVEIVRGVADDLLRVADRVNLTFDTFAQNYARGRNPGNGLRTAFLAELEREVRTSADVLQIPMMKSRIKDASAEAATALARSRADALGWTPLSPGGRRGVQSLDRAIMPYLKLTETRAVALRSVVRGIESTTRFVAILPITAAVLDLVAATDEDQARAALVRGGAALSDMAIGAAIGAGATVIAVTLTPLTLGFYGVVAIRIGLGVSGVYLEERASAFFTERLEVLAPRRPDPTDE